MKARQEWAQAPTGIGATTARRNRPVGRRRIAGPAITAIVAATLAAGVAAPAQAALGGPMGGIDEVNGFPLSFSDGSVGLGQCLSGPQCIGDVERPDTTQPVSYPGNFPVEQFWFHASAGTTANPGLYEAALEGAYGNEAVIAGDEVVFGRIRVILDGLVAGGTYRIQHPYGDFTVTDNGALDERPAAGTIRVTNDAGCLVDALPCGAAGFQTAATAFLGNSVNPASGFLTQANQAPGFIGDVLNPGPVSGAPSGLNSVIVTGPNINPGGLDVNTLTVTDFGVSGMLAGDPVAPSTPTAPIATAGSASALVRWTAPANGGSPITSYSVQAFTAAGATFGIPSSVPAATGTSANSLNITGLANGTAYRFQVTATNAVGTSVSSVASNTVTAATAPVAPVIGTAIAGIGSAVVRWSAPANAATSAINGYSVRVVNNANVKIGGDRPIAAGRTSVNIPGLANGTKYRFLVQAKNPGSASAFSGSSNTVTVGLAPSRPVIGTASAGVAGGTINAIARWTPPVATGGSAVNGYLVHAFGMNPNGTLRNRVTSAVQPSTARTLNMTLPRGNYRFVVQARNIVGLSGHSTRSALVAAR